MKSLLAVFLLFLTVALQAQTLQLDKTEYYPGETIVASWSGGPANAKDWIGIYKTGQTPQTVNSTLWAYANGTHTSSTGSANATVSFNGSNLAVGGWVLRFFSNDGYTEIATPLSFTVIAPPIAEIQSLSASSYFINGAPIQLSWSILDHGDTITSLTLDDGSGPTSVMGSSTLQVNPSVTTTYTLEVNGDDNRLITIWKDAGNTANLSLEKAVFYQGEPVTATWDGAAGGATDWTGVYKLGDSPGPQLSTQWAYTAETSGTLDFTNLAAGDYYVCRFLNDGYTTEFGPVRFSVLPAPALKITSLVRSGGQVTLTWVSSPAVPAYTIQESADLTLWNDIESESGIPPQLPGFETSRTFTDAAGSATRHFYRVVELE